MNSSDRPASAWVPGVAVIMPCYNGAKTLEESVRSVIAQTWTEWQLMIVDDGSTDDSPRLLRELANTDPRIVVIRNEKPSGASAARNKALKNTRARYAAFLDCDDKWLPHKLEKQLTAMQEHGAALACGPYDVMDGASHVIGHVPSSPGRLTYRGLLSNNFVGCLTAIVDRSLCGDIQFDTALRSSEDYHVWLGILKRGLVAVCVPETVAVYRVHGKSLSSNKLAAARNRWRVYREFEKHGVLTSAFYFAIYAITGVLKMLDMRRGRSTRGTVTQHTA